MTVPSARFVALIAVVILAGCASAGPAPTTPPNVTAAPVPTAEPTPSGLAPGVYQTQLSADTLAAAHARRLNNTSFTRWEELTVRYPNGEVRSEVKRFIQYDARTDHGYLVVRIAGHATVYESGATRWEVYLGNRSFTAVGYGNNSQPTVIRPANTDSAANDVGYERLLNRVGGGNDIQAAFEPFETGDVRVSPAVDVVAFIVEAETRGSGAGPSGPTVSTETDSTSAAIWNASLNAIVTRDGLVRRYRVSYRTTLGEVTVEVTRSVAYASIGSTTVEPPAWYDEAVNQTTE